MSYKTIISGRLEFGSARSFDKAIDLFQHRKEVFYKNEIAVKDEEIFQEENYSIDIPRCITQTTNKTWKNTVSLLDYIAQFAMAGDVRAWMIEEGKVLKERHIEPKSEKQVIQSYLKGRELTDEVGKEAEAVKVLSEAIAKFKRHALAYERRGYVNYLLGNYKDAHADFDKSIKINPHMAAPYMGKAIVYMKEKEWDLAIPELDLATKNSIPLQPIYWKARRHKAQCHLELEEYEKAAFELKLFTKRRFESDNPNVKWRKKAFFDYGKALIALGQFDQAIEALTQSIKLEEGEDCPGMSEPFVLRGIARQKAGEEGYKTDWEKAASDGSEKAKELLEEALA